jgi:hypothetical protein
MKRVMLRSALNRPRADLPVGCTERLDRAFLQLLKYVWNFDRVNRPSIEAMRATVGPQVPVIHLCAGQQISEFLAELPDLAKTSMHPTLTR